MLILSKGKFHSILKEFHQTFNEIITPGELPNKVQEIVFGEQFDQFLLLELCQMGC